MALKTFLLTSPYNQKFCSNCRQQNYLH